MANRNGRRDYGIMLEPVGSHETNPFNKQDYNNYVSKEKLALARILMGVWNLSLDDFTRLHPKLKDLLSDTAKNIFNGDVSLVERIVEENENR